MENHIKKFEHDVFKNLNENVCKVLHNRLFSYSSKILLVFYSALILDNISPEVLSILDNNFVKLSPLFTFIM